MVHRNTYVNGPTVLAETWQVRARPTLFFAGQMSGVEGYVESAASGLLAGLNAAALGNGAAAVGAAADDGDRRAGATTCRTPIPAHYEPSNITFGIMEPLARRAARNRPRARLAHVRARAAPTWTAWLGGTARPSERRRRVTDHLEGVPRVISR